LAAVEKLPHGLNLQSPTQLKWLLRDHLGLDITTLDGRESTDAEVLERLANEGREDVALLLKYREYQKLVTTYFPSYKELAFNGRIHCTFNLDIARTGRTSVNNPSLQNQPAALHKLFIADSGHKIITLDMAAIEPCIVAYYSEDEALCNLIIKNGDFHGMNAKALFKLDCDSTDVKKLHNDLRNLAKTCGLAVLYGAGAKRLKMTLQKAGIHWSDTECQRAVDRLRAAYPEVTKFKKQLDAKAERGEPIRNLLGRARTFSNRDEIFMKNFNGLVQGSASDLLLNSAHRATKEFVAKGLPARMLLTVHDEVLVQSAENCVDEVFHILIKNLTDYELVTRHGNIKLKVEGRVSDRWEK
jgi:DNA polymerase-1